MQDSLQQAPGSGTSSLRTYYLLLAGVFLLLSTFFAVLVSRASFDDDKFRKAIVSIDAIFAVGRPVPVTSLEQDEMGGGSGRHDNLPLRDILERTFARIVDLPGGEGAAFRVEAPSAEIFDEPRPIVRQDRLVSLGRMAASLGAWNGRKGYDLRLVLQVAPNHRAPAHLALMLRRLEVIRRKLAELGADVSRLSYALVSGPSTIWHLEFRPG